MVVIFLCCRVRLFWLLRVIRLSLKLSVLNMKLRFRLFMLKLMFVRLSWMV